MCSNFGFLVILVGIIGCSTIRKEGDEHFLLGTAFPEHLSQMSEFEQKIPSLGTTKAQIREWMGEPQEIFIAGEAFYENEKWVYSEHLKETIPYRTLFFERGVLVSLE